MYMDGYDCVREFNRIVEQYKMSPFGFRLRNTGNLLKLVEYNGLLYIDNDNLYKVVNEVLGPNVSEEIKEYLPSITFSEVISMEIQGFQEQLRLTCIQFVDQKFFIKCDEWIKERKDIYKDPDFQGFFMPQPDRLTGNFRFNPSDEKYPTIEEMFPFGDYQTIRCMDTPTSVSSKNRNDSIYAAAGIMNKPRGKQMHLTKDCLKERPYICEVAFCERAFKRYEHLKRHMKMHTGDRPFKCKFPCCNKSFSRSDNLNQHMKTHTLGMKPHEQICFKNTKRNS